MKSEFDICVIGAGMAGATLTAYLAPKGVKIALIDHCFKEKKRIVGELLQPGAVKSLQQMGLDHLLEGIDAQIVNGYALLQGNESITIPYPQLHKGIGLHNGKFLQQIRASALQHASVTQIHGKALQLIENDQQEIVGVRYRETDTSEIKSLYAPLTITSDGFFSNFRDPLTQNEPSITSYFIGLILREFTLPFPQHGHVFLTGAVPFICYPISGNEVRLLIDFPGEHLPNKEQLYEHLEKNITPHIPDYMLNSYFEALEEGGFKFMPNHYLAAKPIMRKGAVMLGDALNMRHPLTGGGLTAVFSDVQILSRHLLTMPDFDSPEIVFEKIKAYYHDRQHTNANVNILANALYEVMTHDILKTAFFKYLQYSRVNAQESIAILAGLNKIHFTLIKQFVFLAVFGAYSLVRENILNIPKVTKILLDAFKIIKPLAKNELSLMSVVSGYIKKINPFV